MSERNCSDAMSNSEESRNFLIFRKQLSEDFRKWSESVSIQEFIDIFMGLGLPEENIDKLRSNLLKKLQREFEKEANLEVELCCIVELQEELDNPGHIRTKGEIAWRPPGNVKSHLRSQKIESLREARQKLEEKEAAITAENQNLMQLIAARRKQVVRMNKKATSLINHMNEVKKIGQDTDHILKELHLL